MYTNKLIKLINNNMCYNVHFLPQAVVNDYTASKRQQQSPNIKKQHQSTSVHQSTAVHPPTTSAVNRRAKYPVKDCTLIEEDEWTPDPTNSWALTAASPQTHVM